MLYSPKIRLQAKLGSLYDYSALDDPDTLQMEKFIARRSDTESVANLKPSEEILQFDLGKLRTGLDEVLGVEDYSGEGFHALPFNACL